MVTKPCCSSPLKTTTLSQGEAKSDQRHLNYFLFASKLVGQALPVVNFMKMRLMAVCRRRRRKIRLAGCKRVVMCYCNNKAVDYPIGYEKQEEMGDDGEPNDRDAADKVMITSFSTFKEIYNRIGKC